MVNIEDILGRYTSYERDGKSEFANNFELKIFRKHDQIKFVFEMKTEGGFGIVGTTWYGTGIYRSDHLALIIEKESDWTYLIADNERTEVFRDKNESLPIEIYTDENRVVVYHKNIDRYILLNKDKLPNTDDIFVE